MEFQTLFNTAVSGLLLLAGWVLRVLWDSLKQLQRDDRELADKVNKIEVLVAGQYIKRDEFDRVVERLFAKLDQIELKIDGKMDK